MLNLVGLRLSGARVTVTMLDGNCTESLGEVEVRLCIDDQCVDLLCLVSPTLVYDCSVILGMDGITKLGGVCVGKDGKTRFPGIEPRPITAVAVGLVGSESDSGLVVDDCDFSAWFEEGRWTVKWKWKDKEPVLTNQCSQYKVADTCQDAYDGEIEQWIKDKWLELHDESVHGKVEGVIPLMAVFQPNKQRKVRPVMDYGRELNDYINSNPGKEAVVCQDKLRDWRKLGENCCMLDLRKAYLQLHVQKDLQRFQAVRYNGRLYVMTRMGFGLNVAPKIMSMILGKVLSLDERVEAGTDHYIDDIIVNEELVSVEEVRSHLERYGLDTKEPEPLCSARVLGLKVFENANHDLCWKRDNESVDGTEVVSKRELFSICGRLIGHYPVGGWLRVACSYMKRHTSTGGWDEPIPNEVQGMLREVLARIEAEDPVQGKWAVLNKDEGEIWCDASSIAVGVVVQVNGSTIEDGSWLRKGDGHHINVAELESVIKGLNLGVKWKFKRVKVYTDSATVYGWVKSVLGDGRRPKVSGLGEMLIRRRLSMISELIEVYGLQIDLRLVRSEQNLADMLTRVPKKWMALISSSCVAGGAVEGVSSIDRIRDLHDAHHLGVDRTLYSARKVLGSGVSGNDVKRVVAECPVCRQVDPAPARWEKGEVDVAETWYRLSADITHVNGVPYLTVIDCGPSRFAIWRKVRNETADSVALELRKIFLERGAPVEFLSDNGPCFRSGRLSGLMEEWNVLHMFSCAYRASGNGIIERNHRTIKRMMARTGEGAEEMLYYYNSTPNSQGTVPMEQVYSYPIRAGPDTSGSPNKSRPTHLNPFLVGDVVFVKPPNAKCTTVWSRGVVERLVSNTTVLVNGVNRHVADVRFSRHAADCSDGVSDIELAGGGGGEEAVDDSAGDVRDDVAGDDTDAPDDDGDRVVADRAVRERRPPPWMADYCT